MARGILGVQVRLKRVELDQIAATAPGSTIYEAHQRAAERLVAEAKKEAPKRTGNLADSIDYEIRGMGRGLSALIGVADGTAFEGITQPSEYAVFVMDGTSGPIVPTNSPVLVLRDGRGPVYHLSVSGQAANPFLARALSKMRSQDWSA